MILKLLNYKNDENFLKNQTNYRTFKGHASIKIVLFMSPESLG